ncbi:MAG TPA: agmatine deiminase family protein [Candidatus Cloacimonadota bacterium]|nr:agmatine deiminase family protein [Candidatus Cloacimonadota bacterium]
MIINKKSIVLISLMLQLIGIMSLYAQPVNAISVLPLTHHLSEEEQALMPLWTAGRERSTPPLGPVRPVAEFEPLTSVLVRYPLGFPVNLIKQFAEEITVVTIVGSESVKNQAISAYNAAQVNMANCKFMIGATNSYWTRDYGPWFAFDGNNQLSVIDFTYNRPRPLDDALIPIYATYDTLSCYTMSISQTGGNYMTDGISKAASSHIAYTENGNNQTNVDNQMLQYLGVEDYHVLQDPNNTYIDHIDCWGKFLGPDKILIRSVPTSHAQYNALEQMAQYWSNQMSSYNRPFRVYRVYTPNNQPYTNSVILNNRVFVPIMNNSNDAAALQTYRDAMPGYTIIGVLNSSSTPWESTDALHCRTHEIPDRRMLYISHTPLSYDQDLQESYPINVNITSHSNGTLIADSTKVYFKVNQGNYTSTSLNFIENNLYRANIPCPAPGDTVYYYIHGVDSNNKKNNHPIMGAYEPHYFIISNEDDIQAPVISHTPVPIIHAFEFPYTISANVTDNVAVSEVTFQYHTGNPEQVSTLTMAEAEENIWNCQIEMSHFGTSTELYYRILAKDNANPQNVSIFPADSTWIMCQLGVANEDIVSVNNQDQFISVYPNPINFNQSKINLKYSTSDAKQVKFEFFNIKGQKVYEFNQFNRKNDTRNVQLDINNQMKSQLKSGIYFIKMSTKDYSITKKVIVIK